MGIKRKQALTAAEQVINACAVRCLDYEDPEPYVNDVVEWMRRRIIARWKVERERRGAEQARGKRNDLRTL